MAKEYDILKAGDLERLGRDIEGDAIDLVKADIREAARIRCPDHGGMTNLTERGTAGDFRISGCCDRAVELAEAALEKRYG
jgi:hypothetical protein